MININQPISKIYNILDNNIKLFLLEFNEINDYNKLIKTIRVWLAYNYTYDNNKHIIDSFKVVDDYLKEPYNNQLVEDELRCIIFMYILNWVTYNICNGEEEYNIKLTNIFLTILEDYDFYINDLINYIRYEDLKEIVDFYWGEATDIKGEIINFNKSIKT